MKFFYVSGKFIHVFNMFNRVIKYPFGYQNAGFVVYWLIILFINS
jgi:hypothetical protein